MTIADDLDVLVRSRYSILYLVTWEEDRAVEILETIAQNRGKKCLLWSITKGLYETGPGKKSVGSTRDPLMALDAVIDNLEPVIYLFQDFHPFLNDPAVVRKVREVAIALKSSYKTLVLVSPRMVLPQELEKDITVVDLPLPSPAELIELLDKVTDEMRQHAQLHIDMPPETKTALSRALAGLTRKEAENVLAKAVISHGRLDISSVKLVVSEKEQIIRKSGLLEYYATDIGFQDVGGLVPLKEWLQKRGRAFSDEARAFGLPAPKGALMVGIQGCGKSLTAKAVAAEWNVPLLRLDVGRVFSSLVGSSEDNLRRAIRVAESIAPCIFWIDEVEKGFSGAESSGISDGGTSARVLSTFLTWLQEKTSPVFVVATANAIDRLPPEFLRKGRFDEIFFIDLPDAAERREIFAIHLRRRGRSPDAFDLAALARASDGYLGAELEAAVVAALFDAFDSGSDITTEQIARALQTMVPLSQTAAAAIEATRNWAEGRARRASGATDAAPETGVRKLEL